MNLFNGARSFFATSDDHEPIDRERENSLRRMMERGQAFESLRNHHGWKMLTGDAELHIEVLKQNLREANKMSDVRRIQAQLDEAEFWQNYVEHEIAAGENAAQELRLILSARAKETA